MKRSSEGIKSLIIDNSDCSDPMLIKAHIVDCYEKLFKNVLHPSSDSSQRILDIIQTRVSDIITSHLQTFQRPRKSKLLSLI